MSSGGDKKGAREDAPRRTEGDATPRNATPPPVDLDDTPLRDEPEANQLVQANLEAYVQTRVQLGWPGLENGRNGSQLAEWVQGQNDQIGWRGLSAQEMPLRRPRFPHPTNQPPPQYVPEPERTLPGMPPIAPLPGQQLPPTRFAPPGHHPPLTRQNAMPMQLGQGPPVQFPPPQQQQAPLQARTSPSAEVRHQHAPQQRQTDMEAEARHQQ